MHTYVRVCAGAVQYVATVGVMGTRMPPSNRQRQAAADNNRQQQAAIGSNRQQQAVAAESTNGMFSCVAWAPGHSHTSTPFLHCSPSHLVPDFFPSP